MLAWRWYYIIMFGLCAIWSKAQINTDAVIQIGRNALFYKDYVLAMQYFNQAIDTKPYLYEPYYYRAIAKYYLGDNQGAIDDCSRSIERDPYIDETYRLRAINYVRTGRFGLAADDYLSLIGRREISDREVWYNLVLCKAKTNNMDEADRYLDSIITRWPDYSRSYMLKAQIAIVNGDTLMADSLFSQTLAIDADDADAWRAKAIIRFKAGDYAKCEEALDNALFLNPNRADWYCLRGLTRYMRSDTTGATSDYSSALQSEPYNTLALYNRALLYMQTGKEELAVEDLNRVIALMPDDYFSLLNRGLCYQRLQRTAEAQADFEKLKTLIPLFQPATYSHLVPTPPAYRTDDDGDIAKYNYLVAENDDNEALFYVTEYHNRQPRTESTMATMPMFGPTFAFAYNAVHETSSDVALMQPLNAMMPERWQIRLSPNEQALTESQYNIIHAKRTELEQVLSDSTLHISSQLHHAVLLLLERDYDAAIISLTDCIATSSQLAPLYMLRALAQHKKLQISDAEKSSNSALNSSIRRTQLVSITKDLTTAINLSPQSAHLYYNRGCIYAYSGDYKNAIADFTKAIKLSPNMAEAYFNRGICLVNTQNKSAAMQDFSHAGERGLSAAYSVIRYFKN